MKPIFCFYSQFNNFLPRTAIEAEILFAVCLSKKQALTGGKSLACEDKCSKKIGAVLVQQADRRSFEASAVFNFVFFVMLKNKIEQSAAQSCLRKKLSLSEIPTDRTFGNRWSRYKELGKKVPQAYRVYVEDSFLPCDAGDARIFSKEVTHTDNSGDNEEQKVKRYYYHSDHLGSAQFVIDWKGRQYEHIEYTPYGELWTYKSKTAMLFLTTYNNFLAKQPAGLIEETAPGVDKLPFRFTGKELDEETGLYYYGARYLDPKYSRWLSGDPALGEYIPVAPTNDQAKKHNENLPGMGGVFNTVNLHVYHYAGNNPIKYVDPDGRVTQHKDKKGFERIKAEVKDIFGASFRVGLFGAFNGSFGEVVGWNAEVDLGSTKVSSECDKLISEDSAGISAGLNILEFFEAGVEIKKSTSDVSEDGGFLDTLKNIYTNGEPIVDLYLKAGDKISLATSAQEEDHDIKMKAGIGLFVGVEGWLNLSEIKDFFKLFWNGEL